MLKKLIDEVHHCCSNIDQNLTRNTEGFVYLLIGCFVLLVYDILSLFADAVGIWIINLLLSQRWLYQVQQSGYHVISLNRDWPSRLTNAVLALFYAIVLVVPWLLPVRIVVQELVSVACMFANCFLH